MKRKFISTRAQSAKSSSSGFRQTGTQWINLLNDKNKTTKFLGLTSKRQ